MFQRLAFLNFLFFCSTTCCFAQTCNETKVLENFRWFNRDAPNSPHTAAVRGVIVRVVNSLDTDELRGAYKEGQKHNSDAAKLIDDCDDQAVVNLAYTMAEEVRIDNCTGGPPARSASCGDVYENIRWSLFEAGICSNVARTYFGAGLRPDTRLYRRADLIRRAVKAAEGHRREIYDSVDYIGDDLLVRIAEQVVREHSIQGLDMSFINNQSLRLRCPGIALMENKK